MANLNKLEFTAEYYHFEIAKKAKFNFIMARKWAIIKNKRPSLVDNGGCKWDTSLFDCTTITMCDFNNKGLSMTNLIGQTSDVRVHAEC